MRQEAVASDAEWIWQKEDVVDVKAIANEDISKIEDRKELPAESASASSYEMVPCSADMPKRNVFEKSPLPMTVSGRMQEKLEGMVSAYQELIAAKVADATHSGTLKQMNCFNRLRDQLTFIVDILLKDNSMSNDQIKWVRRVHHKVAVSILKHIEQLGFLTESQRDILRRLTAKVDRALKLDCAMAKLPPRMTRDWASMSTQARIYELIDFLNEVAIDKAAHARLSYYGPSVAGLTTNE